MSPEPAMSPHRDTQQDGATSARRLPTNILLVGLVTHPDDLQEMSEVEKRDMKRITNLREIFDHVFTIAEYATRPDVNYHSASKVGRKGAENLAGLLKRKKQVIKWVMVEHIRMFNGYYQKLVMPNAGKVRHVALDRAVSSMLPLPSPMSPMSPLIPGTGGFHLRFNGSQCAC